MPLVFSRRRAVAPGCVPPRGTRRGVALVTALMATMIVAVLSASAFFTSMQEYRISHHALAQPRALAAAELGLHTALAAWPTLRSSPTRVLRVDTMDISASVALVDTVLGDGAVVSRRVTRLDPVTYLVVSSGLLNGATAQTQAVRRVGSIIRLELPDFKSYGAITARGRTLVSGTVTISGVDGNPPGLDCKPASDTLAAFVVNDSAANTSATGGCAHWSCVTGDPKVVDSTALVADTSTFTDFGVFNYDSLTRLASPGRTLTTGGVVDQIKPSTTFNAGTSVCNEADPKNWGNVAELLTIAKPECEHFFPVVWLKGPGQSWTLSNSGGQGVLLVDGDVSFAGYFRWTGVVLVRGRLSTSGNGAGGYGAPKLTGVLMAMNRNGGNNSFSGSASIQYSGCAVQQATLRLATVKPARWRGWMDMF